MQVFNLALCPENVWAHSPANLKMLCFALALRPGNEVGPPLEGSRVRVLVRLTAFTIFRRNTCRNVDSQDWSISEIGAALVNNPKSWPELRCRRDVTCSVSASIVPPPRLQAYTNMRKTGVLRGCFVFCC